MSLNNSLTARLDELRSRNLSRLHSENTTGQSTPSFRHSGSFMSPPQAPTPIEPPNLQRRFTTDLSKMQPQVPPIGQQLGNGGSSNDVPASMFKKAQLFERKKQEYELAAEQRNQFRVQMQLFNEKDARELQELEQIGLDLQKAGINPGYQSEPTTPPRELERRGAEHRDSVSYGSSVFSRSNRYSTSTFASPPGNTRSSRSGSQLTSPPSELTQIPQNHIAPDALPSKSVPGSRRGSNDRTSAFVPETSGSARRNAASSNRYSMPVTGLRNRTHESVPEGSASASMDMEPLNTTSFLFEDEERTKESLTSPEIQKYLHMNDNNFPVLIRQNEASGTQLSAASAALDLALSQSPGMETQGDSWNAAGRHRLSLQHNLQQSNGMASNVQNNSFSTLQAQKSPEPKVTSRQTNRHSMEASVAAYSQAGSGSQVHPQDSTRPSLANSHASYSTNDVPTVKNTSSLSNVTPPKNHTQHFHNHNASLGRIPQHAGSSAFSPTMTTTSSPTDPSPGAANSYNPMAFANPQMYAGYGMQLMNMSMNPMMQTPLAFQNQMQMFQNQNGFLPYANYAQQARFHDGSARMGQQRRAPHGDDQARFSNMKLETVRGEILSLCKDQHGCRYLQKKLEERSPENVQLIFLETCQHVVELMTDPFGNYLCQKLLEFSNDEQRTVLINNAAPEMVKIALNSHGTRALQKMIEFISTPEQVSTIIRALTHQVVELIQDLNGNHVIQKCLNRLSADDAQFIFTAVGNSCVAVGTHRHGCCVLQRCIDHASGAQKAQLIGQITEHAFHLVQDPFGNYVLQYIVDLQESCFTDPLCYTFQGQIPQLSKQKFSSNVIEKCLRGADPSVTRVLIEEMLNLNELEKMLRDSYANYVVQTAMDYADPNTKTLLVDAIRPILPAVRQTPHGRRIQSKIMALDGQGRSRSPSVNGYSQSMNAQVPTPFSGSYPHYSAGQSHPMANGSNFAQYGTDLPQQSSYGRLPQVNGNFF